MTLSLYKEEYCQMLIDHMSKGYSFESFAGTVSCTGRTLDNWVLRHPEFKEAKGIGLKKGLAFLEKLLFEAIKDKNMNYGPVIFALKTRFYKMYGDKSKLDIQVQQKSIEQLLEEKKKEFVEAEFKEIKPTLEIENKKEVKNVSKRTKRTSKK